MVTLLRVFLKKIYAHPLVAQLDINSQEAFSIHKRIIKENPLLRNYYKFIYQHFGEVENSLSHFTLPSLEIGSGGGFLKEFLPQVITSDVVIAEGIDRIEDASHLSFSDNSLKAIYANGVLHHVLEPVKCLEEIQRVLAPGGFLVCNEPSSTLFGYFMNKFFHHEYTNKYTKQCAIERKGSQGRLTNANMAIPYIIFKKDKALFSQRFKRLRLISIIYHDFLRYSLSGGLSYKPFVPEALYGFVDFIEKASKAAMALVGQAMIVKIQKI